MKSRFHFLTLTFCLALAIPLASIVYADAGPGSNLGAGEIGSAQTNDAATRSLEELCGLTPPPDWWKTARFESPPMREPLPAAFDWRERGAVPPVRSQGSCGSCWAFATVGVMECGLRIFQNVSADLSEQYLVSCNSHGWGCGGGWWAHSYHVNPGAMLEACFPYVASDVPCQAGCPHPYRLDSWAYIEDRLPSVQAIKQAIYTYGPVAAAVYVGPAFQRYSGGVFATNENGTINHGIVLVGWDDNQGPNGVWILRNSWGSGWGEGGYMRIAYNTSQVGYSANCVILNGSIPPDPPRVGSAVPETGWCQPKRLQYFTTEYIGQNIRYAELMVNRAADSEAECVYARYDFQLDKLYLRSNDNTRWQGGYHPGDEYIIANRYGRLVVERCEAFYIGDTLRVTWAIKFTPRFSPGAYNLYARAINDKGVSTGWEDKGDWVVNHTPKPVYLYPSDGASQAGQDKLLITRYQDADGWNHLEDVYLLITDSAPVGSPLWPVVHLRYDPQADRFYIRDEGDTAWLPSEGIVPGWDDPQNFGETSVCILWGKKSRAREYNGKTVEVQWHVRFKSSYQGQHLVYLRAIDAIGAAGGGDSGWKRKGSWRVKPG